jgi:hypothetical protein
MCECSTPPVRARDAINRLALALALLGAAVQGLERSLRRALITPVASAHGVDDLTRRFLEQLTGTASGAKGSLTAPFEGTHG